MNIIGINPMGMNPLGINQIGMINNQQYFMNGINMDETAQNLKNIIQPYENKIRELEEIIRQKDFEIILLKHKINNIIPNIPNINFMNMNNPMMMNMNMSPLMINMENLNQQQNEKGKEIKVGVQIKNEIFNGKYISFFEGDKASIIKEKFNIKENYLIYNYKEVDYSLTIKENEISDYSIINATNLIYDVIFTTTTGNTKTLHLDPDCPVEMAIIIYCIYKNKVYDLLEGSIFFLYNAYKIKIRDKTHIKDYFKGTTRPKIVVNDYVNLIGGWS